jgi:hypothetical protein
VDLGEVSIATAKPTATTSRPSILARLDSPRLRSRETLIQSSTRPDHAGADDGGITMRPVRVKTRPERTWAAR